MATTRRGVTVPEGTDDVNIPGDIATLVDTTVPSLTTAAISALSWADKPAGWKAYDTTLGREVISTGAAMVPVVDTRGATFEGEVKFTGGDSDGNRGVQFTTSGTARFFVAYNQNTNALTVLRYSAAGAFQDSPFSITSAGQVVSSSHIGGVWSGTLNGSSYAVVTGLPTSPTGRWSAVANLVGVGFVGPVASTSTSVTFDVRGNTGAAVPGTSVTLHWHAVAY